MRTLVFAAALALAGCGMKNEDIVKQTKYCEDHEMRAVQILNGIDYAVMRVQCASKGEK